MQLDITTYPFSEMVIYYQKMKLTKKKRSLDPEKKGSLDLDTTGILVNNVTEPRGLCVDWIRLHLYFIDGLRKSINIVKMSNDKVRKEIILGLKEPQDIVLASRQIYISDYGTNAKIYAANLDGSGLRPLVESKVLWPTSLAIDYPNSRLYWTDLKLRTIDSILLNGSQRKLVKKFHPKVKKC